MIDDKLVKKPYQSIPYSPEQIQELKNCMHPENGPLYFLENFMYIQHPTQGRMLIELYPFQYGLVKTYHDYRKSISLISRQMGKCQVGSTEIEVKSPDGIEYKMPMDVFHELQNHPEKAEDLNIEQYIQN